MRYKFEITIKEVGRETPIKTSYIGDVNFTESKGWQCLPCNK